MGMTRVTLVHQVFPPQVAPVPGSSRQPQPAEPSGCSPSASSPPCSPSGPLARAWDTRAGLGAVVAAKAQAIPATGQEPLRRLELVEHLAQLVVGLVGLGWPQGAP